MSVEISGIYGYIGNLKLAFKLSILGFILSIITWIIYWSPLLSEILGYSQPIIRSIVRYHYIAVDFLTPILKILTWIAIISSITVCLTSLKQGWNGRLGYYTLGINIISFIVITHNIVGGLLELIAFLKG